MSSPCISTAIWEPQISIAEASINDMTYTYVGTFSAIMEWLYFVSTMDSALIISFDGVNDHLTLPIGNTYPAAIDVPFKANNTNYQPLGVYVKSAGTTSVGSLYVSGFSAKIP